MPLYVYRCLGCNDWDQQLAGLDDHTALCTACGGLMLREDQDVFRPYFGPASEPDQYPAAPLLTLSQEPGQESHQETDEKVDSHRPYGCR